MILEEYLNKINGKINAPTFAYITLYGEYPDPPISGREISHPTRNINGIDIDKNIPIKSLTEIFNISEIETRSSCEGQDERHPTFLIFRLLDRKESSSKKLVDKLNKQDKIKCAYDIGQGGLPRICVTWSTWYSHKDFINWWKTLPSKIKKCL